MTTNNASSSPGSYHYKPWETFLLTYQGTDDLFPGIQSLISNATIRWMYKFTLRIAEDLEMTKCKKHRKGNDNVFVQQQHLLEGKGMNMLTTLSTEPFKNYT